MSSLWYLASSSSSSCFFGKRKKTMTAPSRIATMPAVYAQSAPSRNDSLAPAVMASAYCGYCCAVASALAKDLVSCAATLSEI